LGDIAKVHFVAITAGGAETASVLLSTRAG
jgi:hypothetical protein